MKALKNKSTGVEVKILQVFLDVAVDGKFGPKTAAALNVWKDQYCMPMNSIMSESDWGTLAALLPVIKQGNKSKYVKMWQLFLNIEADGAFGSKTFSTTRAYQATNNLLIDGVVGKETWLKAFAGKTQLIDSTPAVIQKNSKPIDYKQYDSRWGSIKYSTHTASQTIRNSGCGPTSMADIVATWWDKRITPVELCEFSVKNGYRTENSGTAWGFFKFIAEKYGASKFIQTSSYATAESAIKEGAYVVCSMKPGLFTKGGHFICWWKTDGKYNYTNDPASSAAKRAKQEIKYIKNECKQFFIFYK